MKKFLVLIVFIVAISCKKDKEVLTNQATSDSTVVSDSLQNSTIENPNHSGAFQVVPQDVKIEKGKAVFKQGGKVMFYFDQNSNSGVIQIDQNKYNLSKFDFTENNYEISGSGVKIDASNGDFKDAASDCVSGNFPEISVSLGGKTVNLTNVEVQDCPNY